METLKLDKQRAKSLFPGASKLEQEILISTFGKEFFSGKITNRIKTFEDAFTEADEDVRQEYLKSTQGYNTPDEIAYKKLKLIISVINEDVILDWRNTNQQKWYPYFVWSSGSGFDYSYSGYVSPFALTCVGLRLCTSTKEKCAYVATQFIDLYNDLLN